MAKIETYVCDIDSCNKIADHRNNSLQVIFTTEQTEGRTVKPYLDTKCIDLCDDHYRKLVSEGKYIVANGAQGHNTYKL